MSLHWMAQKTYIVAAISTAANHLLVLRVECASNFGNASSNDTLVSFWAALLPYKSGLNTNPGSMQVLSHSVLVRRDLHLSLCTAQEWVLRLLVPMSGRLEGITRMWEPASTPPQNSIVEFW